MHPELTGKENIYLNGAFLGMSKAEINEKIDEIIEFSGCQMYIDTPVKRYSSGMRVRLGFAVAAFLEPDILVVDEVLAVGDAEFQKKAIGKMKDISQGGGRTILFVSHDLAAIENLCERLLVLDRGYVVYDTQNVSKGIEFYLSNQNDGRTILLEQRKDREGSGEIRVIEVIIENDEGNQISTVRSGQRVFFKFKCRSLIEQYMNLSMSFSITKSNGSILSLLESEISTNDILRSDKKEFSMICCIDSLPFVEGSYVCNIALKSGGNIIDWVRNAFTLDVANGNFFNTGKTTPASHQGVLINQKWKIE